jgi:hypothetical protein
MAVVREFPDRPSLGAEAARIVSRTDSVLDVGCGIRPQELFDARVHVCLEPHLPYLARLMEEGPVPPGFVPVNAGWREFMERLPDGAFDTVFALDFIEHLDRGEGAEFLLRAERVARRQVVVFTPLGYYRQDLPEDGRTDRWGMDGAGWQVHRSGWEPSDFDGRWVVLLCRSFHPPETGPGGEALPTGAFWAVLDKPGAPLPPARAPAGARPGPFSRIRARLAGIASRLSRRG